MTKTHKIIYWIATIWLALGMLSTGIVQIIKLPHEAVENVVRLGYPVYVMTILGVWKILGVVAVLVPKYPLIKEWAYAGFFFTMTGAAISHIVVRDPFSEIFPSVLLLILTVVSWYFRPESRKFAQ
jgi:DoxX-like family